MAEAVARGRFLRIGPRKARLVADLIRGKRVAEARDILQFSAKKAGPIIGKLLDAAAANAEHKALEQDARVDPDEMVVSKILVDGGPVMKRVRPASRGRRMLIRKRTSHVTLVIDAAEGE